MFHQPQYAIRHERQPCCGLLQIAHCPHTKLGLLPHSCSSPQSAAEFIFFNDIILPAAASPDDSSNPEAGFLSHLRNALMAEVSGLVENIQEVCALIRADATDLANPAPSDSPRRQANEVLLSSCHS